MIRINLLEETRQAAAKAKGGGGFGLPKIQVAENVPVFILAGGVAAAVLAVAVGWLYLNRQIANLDESIRQQEEEKKRLEFVLKQNEELLAKQADLKRKIGVITELKLKQAGPVKMLDQVSKSLADDIWLDKLTYNDPTVELSGKALSALAYGKFLSNLESNTFFKDVAGGKMTNDPRSGLTTFTLTLSFVPPPEPGTAEAAPQGQTTTTTSAGATGTKP